MISELPVKARTIHINPHFKGKVNIPTSKTLRQTSISKNSVVQTFTSTPATNSLSYQPSLNLPSNKTTNQVIPTPNLPVPSNLQLPPLPPLGILPAVLNRPPPPVHFLHQLHSIGIPKVHIPPQVFATNIAQALHPPPLQYKPPPTLVPAAPPVVSNNIPIPAASSVISDVKESAKVETSKSSKNDVKVDSSEIKIKAPSSVITLTGAGLLEKDQIKYVASFIFICLFLNTLAAIFLQIFQFFQRKVENHNKNIQIIDLTKSFKHQKCLIHSKVLLLLASNLLLVKNLPRIRTKMR